MTQYISYSAKEQLIYCAVPLIIRTQLIVFVADNVLF